MKALVTSARLVRTANAVIEKLSASPVVETAALVNYPPLSLIRVGVRLTIDGIPPPPSDRPWIARYFVTSPGFLRGRTSRGDAGLPVGGMFRVVTDLAVFAFDDTTRAMKAISLNPGVTRNQLQDSTGFEIVFDRDIGPTAPPTAHELATLRKFDPDKLFTA